MADRRHPGTNPADPARTETVTVGSSPVRVAVPGGEPPTGGFPLVVVLDGDDLLAEGFAPLARSAAATIGTAPPVVAFLPGDAGADHRDGRAEGDGALAELLADQLVPAVRATFPLAAVPGRTIVGGVGRGGLAAVTAALRRPDAFGHAVSLSGAFWWPSPDEPAVVVAIERAAPGVTQFHLAVGSSDAARPPRLHGTTMRACTQETAALLVDAGFRVTVAELPGGDDAAGWRRAWPVALGEALAPTAVLTPPAGPGDTTPPRYRHGNPVTVPVPLDAPSLRRRLTTDGTPLVDPAPGRSDRVVATFAWLGDQATSGVELRANKLTDFAAPDEGQLLRLGPDDRSEPTLWARSYDVPRDWRGSYLLVPSGGTPQVDPRNPRRIHSKFEVGDLSVAAMPDAPGIDDWVRRAGVPEGSIERIRHRSAVLGHERDVWIATAGATPARPPAHVLVLLDGEVWARIVPVLPLLDNLVADGAIPPCLVVMPDSLGPAAREREMAGDPRFVELLLDLVGPVAARAGVPLDPAITTVAGQSLGGLTAAYATLLRPDVFGAALCQSPSVWWPRRAGASEWLTSAYRRAPVVPGAPARRLALQVGTDETTLHGPTERFRGVVEERARTAGDCELVDAWMFSGGHDHACWQAGLARGLRALLGTGPGA